MEVSFKVNKYEDTVLCNVVPMMVCHLLLGHPWLFDRNVYHDGRANTYSFKWEGKNRVLLPLTPSQIHAAKQKRQEKSQHVVQHGKPKVSTEKVLIATKTDLKEASNDPSVMHFVLVYKDTKFMLTTNDLNTLPSVV